MPGGYQNQQMCGGSEVGRGEFAMQSTSSVIVGTCSILRRVVDPEVYLSPFVADLGEPRATQFRSIRNTSEPSDSTLPSGTVGAVLPVRRKSDIRSLIVETVPIPVVNLNPRRRVEDESVKLDALTIYPALCVIPIASTQGMPLVCQDALSILDVDDGDFTLSQGDDDSIDLHRDLLCPVATAGAALTVAGHLASLLDYSTGS